MRSREQRLDRLLLKRPQRRPAEAVDDVVLDGGVKPIEGAHGPRSMSSTVAAPLAARSTVVISGSAIVSE